MCTGVRFTGSDGEMYFGRNLDWSCGYGERVRVMPKGFPASYRFMDGAPAAHAAIGMCVDFNNYPMFFDCGNDAGLAVAGLNFPGYAAYAEVEAALASVTIVGASAGEGLGVSYLHWIIGDAERSIVVESRADGMHVLDDPVDVLANQPSLEWHLENLRGYITATNGFPATAKWRAADLAPYGAGAGMRLLLAVSLREGRLPQRQLPREGRRARQRDSHAAHARGRCHGGGRGPHGQRRLREDALHELLLGQDGHVLLHHLR